MQGSVYHEQRSFSCLSNVMLFLLVLRLVLCRAILRVRVVSALSLKSLRVVREVKVL